MSDVFNFVRSNIATLILITISQLSAINISKLILPSARVTNVTSNDKTLNVTFYKKCPDCPCLRDDYEKTFVVKAGEKLLITDAPNYIKTMSVSDQGAYLYLTSKVNPPCKIFEIGTKQRTDFPYYVDFDSTLKDNDDYEMLKNGHRNYVKCLPVNVSFKDFFGKVKNIYQKNNLKAKQNASNGVSKTPKIPHYIHICWFGGFEQPKLFKQWQDEWKTKHSDWTLMLWNEDRIKREFPDGLFNKAVYTQAEDMYDYATMSKIARYEILNKYGGLYVDPDIRCFESFAPLHQAYDFYCGLGHFDTWGCINNGVFGSRSGHPILKACMDYIKNCETPPGGFYDWTSKNLGHQMFTLCVYNSIDQKSNVDIIFPATFFDGNDVEMEFNHIEEPVQAAYTHLASQPESFCARGIYSYSVGVSQSNVTTQDKEDKKKCNG